MIPTPVDSVPHTDQYLWPLHFCSSNNGWTCVWAPYPVHFASVANNLNHVWAHLQSFMYTLGYWTIFSLQASICSTLLMDSYVQASYPVCTLTKLVAGLFSVLTVVAVSTSITEETKFEQVPLVVIENNQRGLLEVVLVSYASYAS